MDIIVVGLSHKTASVEVREKLSFPEAKLPDALACLGRVDSVNENVILSTCNRVETYAAVKDVERGIERVKDFYLEYHGLSDAKYRDSLYAYHGREAIRHSFRVAASLDSMVVGEPQILGQLKDAFDHALTNKTSGLVMNRLMKKSISVAKRIRTETKIAESAVSISFAAVELARKIFGNLDGKSCMLVGAGEMAELAAKHLVNNGVKSVLVANRTYENAVKLAEEFDGRAVRYEDLVPELVHADIVIASTGAAHYILTQKDLAKVIRDRKNRPVFLIDIAVPRNLDPDINKIDNVYLYDIDDLQTVVASNIKERQKEAELAEEIIEDEIDTFLAWFNSIDVVPTIVALRDHAESIRQAELEKSLSKMGDLSEKQKKQIEGLTQAIVNKLLHTPQIVLKQSASDPEGSAYIQSARVLFGLSEPDATDHEEAHPGHEAEAERPGAR
ncbi:MAG: glutamyl-tRNA reductase [Nitrospirae bacterium]|nr:glutamyl-tRNA reductase [Nitrospirota bacterium]MBI5696076.1 glutamyl-tRNA reductase [Nitrospirota bacterium]